MHRHGMGARVAVRVSPTPVSDQAGWSIALSAFGLGYVLVRRRVSRSWLQPHLSIRDAAAAAVSPRDYSNARIREEFERK